MTKLKYDVHLDDQHDSNWCSICASASDGNGSLSGETANAAAWTDTKISSGFDDACGIMHRVTA